MKSYRPNVEMQKRRYSLRLSLLRLRKGKPFLPLRSRAIASRGLRTHVHLPTLKRFRIVSSVQSEAWSLK